MSARVRRNESLDVAARLPDRAFPQGLERGRGLRGQLEPKVDIDGIRRTLPRGRDVEQIPDHVVHREVVGARVGVVGADARRESALIGQDESHLPVGLDDAPAAHRSTAICSDVGSASSAINWPMSERSRPVWSVMVRSTYLNQRCCVTIGSTLVKCLTKPIHRPLGLGHQLGHFGGPALRQLAVSLLRRQVHGLVDLGPAERE